MLKRKFVLFGSVIFKLGLGGLRKVCVTSLRLRGLLRMTLRGFVVFLGIISTIGALDLHSGAIFFASGNAVYAMQLSESTPSVKVFVDQDISNVVQLSYSPKTGFLYYIDGDAKVRRTLIAQTGELHVFDLFIFIFFLFFRNRVGSVSRCGLAYIQRNSNH